MGAPESNLAPLDERLASGDRDALVAILTLLYDDLCSTARRQLFHTRGAEMQPRELVHEVCLRLLANRTLRFDNCTHLRAVALTAMRQIVIDQARRRSASRNGGAVNVVSLESLAPERQPESHEPVSDGEVSFDALRLTQVLHRLESQDERRGRVVVLRGLEGLTLEETATALGVSRATVCNDWREARTWIVDRLVCRDASAAAV